jgi:hypothetical protein
MFVTVNTSAEVGAPGAGSGAIPSVRQMPE